MRSTDRPGEVTLPPVRRIRNFLHRHGIARVINSSSSSLGGPIVCRLEAKPWTPRRLVRWQAEAEFRCLYSHAARTHRLASLAAGKRTTAGTVRWVATFRNAGPFPR